MAAAKPDAFSVSGRKGSTMAVPQDRDNDDDIEHDHEDEERKLGRVTQLARYGCLGTHQR